MPEENDVEAQRPAAVALIRPRRLSDQVTELMRAAEEASALAGLRARAFGTKCVRLLGEVVERRETELLEPNDAHRLYTLAHEVDVLVLTFTEAYVRRDPGKTPATRDRALGLRTFVEHKAFFGLVRGRPDIKRIFAAFADWRAAPADCHGFNDPRVLPLHVFETSGDWARLGEPLANAEFQRRYGKASNRLDDGGKDWARASAFHGSDRLTIARHRLEPGAHWDVTTQRQSATLRTSHEIWHMPSKPRDYLNVYPNEYVRKTSGSGCKRVFPRP